MHASCSSGLLARVIADIHALAARGIGCVALAVASVAVIALAAIPMQAENSGRGKPPKMTINTVSTPFAKGLQDKVDKKLNEAKKQNPNCDRKPNKSERWLALQCGVPAVEITESSSADCPDCGVTDSSDEHGSRRQVKNKVVLYYDAPAQRDLNAWPSPSIDRNRPRSGIETNRPDPRSSDPMEPLVEPSSMNVSKEEVLAPEDCVNFGVSKGLPPGLGDLQPDGSCDVSRAFVVATNKAAKEADAHGHAKNKEKAFDADDTGHCAPAGSPLAGDAAIKCGGEARQQVLTETLTAVCHAPFTYVDGECVKPNDGNIEQQLRFMGYGAPSAATPAPIDAGDPTSTVTRNAMMGFTFAPPELKWGIDYSEEACVDLVFVDFCFTLFAARIGYDFDVAMGLRLPVQLDIEKVPTPATAQTDATLEPKLTPVDFTAADYKTFCGTNGMADGFIIADCDRFSFPEFLSSELNGVYPGLVAVDGKELVAQAKIFAGIQVVILEIPIIDLAIDAGSDFATLCTMTKLKNSSLIGDFANFGADLISGQGLLGSVKQQGLNCTSFTTPFGSERNVITGALEPRTFPFLGTYHLGADCLKAELDGDTVTIKGKKRPICTGLQLKYKGMSLGLGLDLELGAGSSLITANWTPVGDASGTGSRLDFRQPPFQDIINPTLGPVRFDNLAADTDTGIVRMDDFTYWLNTLVLGVNANVEFGGILSFLPDMGSIPIFKLALDFGDFGLPLPQHNGTKPVDVPVYVNNYAVGVAGVVSAENPAPSQVNSKTLKIKPGEFGKFDVQVMNLGSVVEDVDNFARALPDADAQFNLPPGWTTVPDVASLAQQSVANVAKHSTAAQTVALSISPVRHPLTRPGTYPVILTADSRQARTLGLEATDPKGLKRTGATDTVFVEIVPFYDPRLTVDPESSSGKPGTAARRYGVRAENFGNVADTAALSVAFPDSNHVGCTLTTLGSTAECPFRAAATAIPASAWTTVGSLPAGLGPLEPTNTAETSFTITVPADWAGMQNTKYEVVLTSTSTSDPGTPRAHNAVTLQHTVIATKQSMARYIGLELEELAQVIEAANAAGTKSGGGLPIIRNAVQGAHARALASIMEGDLGAASKTLGTEMQTMAAFLRAINGPSSISPAQLQDWTARANAIMADLEVAQASNVTSN